VSYCQCDACRQQDDPASIEPSSNLVSVTDRYVDFFNDIARRIALKHPNSLLNFYGYADYTQAPTRDLKLEKNLVAWIAPIRYCRYHAIGQANCPSRQQLAQMLDGWAKASKNIAYRTYNYNLAECLVPFSMLSVWKHDIPYLKQHGCIAINLETLASWHIYGPHMYLSIRVAYNPDADADAIMDDYFARFYGPGAGPLMKQYWMEIDRAFEKLDGHSGSFYVLHRVYTPQLLARLQSFLIDAAKAARDEDAYAARVAMHAEGFANAQQFIELREAINAGRIPEVQKIYQHLLSRTQAQVTAGYGNHYTPEYLKRFIGTHVEALIAAAASHRVLMVLPDRMRLAYDPQDQGLKSGFADPAIDDAKWRLVATYSDTLNAQGLPDEKTILWYRAGFDVPPSNAKRSLFFMEVDGAATVFLNGKQIGASDRKRTPFEIDASAALHPGHNVVAIRVDHSRITELMLGGIIRPILLMESATERP